MTFQFHYIIAAIQDGTHNNEYPSAVFISSPNWVDLYNQLPLDYKTMKNGKALESGHRHFVIHGIPVMTSAGVPDSVVMVVNHNHPYDGKYNFAKVVI